MLLRPESDPVAIDLFCGAGGLSLGLRDAGFTIGAAIDSDPIAVRTYQDNLGHHVICGRIEEVSANDLMAKAGVSRGECSLLAGGPPCQGFSLQRRGQREDLRNALILQYLRMIEDILPKFFLMENVSGLLNKHGKPFLDQLLAGVERLGYVVQLELLDARDFGVPQRRKRAFLVGARTSARAPTFRFPKPTSVDSPRTVRDAIADLPSPPQDGSCHPDVANHFREARLSPINLERIRHVPPGGGRENIPEHLQLACHKNNKGHRHLDVYGRLAWDEPSVTLTARFDSFSRGRFAHPEEHRSLTIREGARIQTFPDWLVFAGNREDQARQVGNAVPPLLAQCLGKNILTAFKRLTEQNIAA